MYIPSIVDEPFEHDNHMTTFFWNPDYIMFFSFTNSTNTLYKKIREVRNIPELKYENVFGHSHLSEFYWWCDSDPIKLIRFFLNPEKY